MTLAVAEALNPNKPNQQTKSFQTTGNQIRSVKETRNNTNPPDPNTWPLSQNIYQVLNKNSEMPRFDLKKNENTF